MRWGWGFEGEEWVEQAWKLLFVFKEPGQSLSYVWLCWHKDLWWSSEKSPHISGYFILRLNEWQEFTFPGIFYSSSQLKSWLWGEEGSVDTELILTLHSSPQCYICLSLFCEFVIPVGPTLNVLTSVVIRPCHKDKDAGWKCINSWHWFNSI